MDGGRKMTGQTIRKPQDFETEICPYCMKKLNIVEIVKRKLVKKCRCVKCNRIIDERIVIH